MEDLPKSTGGDFAGRKPIGGLRKNQSRYRLTASTRTLPTVPARPAHCRGRPHACGVILLLSLASPRTGGPHACHYRTAGSDSCARRRGRVAARGARAARRADAADRPPPKGLSGIMRSTVAACAIVVLLIGTADAEQCPPGALGVSRTLVVDPNEHPRVGYMQYPETLPLNDHEVVLTFDDGPVPRYTNPVLETLASECVKATFFMVGQMARAYPLMVRRVYDEGHTIANHTQNHPIRKMSVDQAAREIEEGFESLRKAIGDLQAVSPFFRIPGLLRQKSVEQYLAAHGDMTWSADFLADDWTRINDSEVARRAISRIEARGRGILLLHDIHPRTVLALPEILNEFKSRGYKIVHVVAAAADRPKTATPEQHTSPSQMRPLRRPP